MRYFTHKFPISDSKTCERSKENLLEKASDDDLKTASDVERNTSLGNLIYFMK